ncbi:uncharacterized protein CANTADRAFT_168257 [Suhomyces tanzawaensis NRRL Y-17324]|uniref:Uncharacterized protein n=1 Tax=Suhomyces tanzawaensis NRRL Y-17324 TaxID=984487 RepID=A0A1E4SMB4_9ASCO|nr:uncharacterized protein CANTADRAFT_168257 [Suhomyces tanzawaensis NRRL Y-17324]ODV80650.1 hypothetical protein CANTADRAFT_168257 [Suhomyces tanzawaensis NRRL Y-17324]
MKWQKLDRIINYNLVIGLSCYLLPTISPIYLKVYFKESQIQQDACVILAIFYVSRNRLKQDWWQEYAKIQQIKGALNCPEGLKYVKKIKIEDWRCKNIHVDNFIWKLGESMPRSVSIITRTIEEDVECDCCILGQIIGLS